MNIEILNALHLSLAKDIKASDGLSKTAQIANNR